MALKSPIPWAAPAGATLGPAGEDGSRIPRLPCGVPDFDFITGGFPVGSVVLLVGEAGSGHQEFALTSAVNLMLHYDDPALHQFFLGSARGPFVYPEGVAYVSLTRSREQLMSEVAVTFDSRYHEVLQRHLKFHDLSPEYFGETVVPPEWSAASRPLLKSSNGGTPQTILSAVAQSLETDGANNMVIVDSLTDLLVRPGANADELLALVKGLRRRAKSWNAAVYLLLSKGVTASAVEQALYDSVDGVLSFLWTSSPTHSRRHRSMLVEKFMPILAHVPPEQQGRFVVQVGHVDGLVTTQYERI